MNESVDPTMLSIYERLTQYPESYTDEDLEDIMLRYEGVRRGQWGRFPVLAFLILEKRRSVDYTKEEL